MKRAHRVITGIVTLTAMVIIVPAAQAAWTAQLVDGAGGTAGCAAKTSDSIDYQVATITYNSQLNGIYYDSDAGNLRRVILGRLTCPTIQVVDGAGGGGGRVNANVGQEPATSGFGGNLNVFYYDSTHGNLRHAWLSGSTWHYEVVDGAGGGGGRVNANVGTWPTTTTFGGKLYVVYVNQTAGTIRLGIWNGSAWSFQTLDGQGGGGRISDATTGGQLGFNTTAAVYGGQVHLFYFYLDPFCDPDDGCDIFGAIREARSSNGTSWTFANPAGFPLPNGGGGGMNCCHDGQSLATVKKSSSQQFLVYENFGVHGSDIRSLTWNGSAWGSLAKVEDNDFGSGDLGFYASAVNLSGKVHVFYEGFGPTIDGVRDTTWNGSAWVVNPLPGVDFGGPTASTVVNGKISVLLGSAAVTGTSGGNDLVLANGP